MNRHRVEPVTHVGSSCMGIQVLTLEEGEAELSGNHVNFALLVNHLDPYFMSVTLKKQVH